MGVSPRHYEAHREHARHDPERDDQFTVLFFEMVEAFVNTVRPGCTPEHYAFYSGLRRAYALVTGDAEEAVHHLVKTAAFRQAYSAEPVAADLEQAVPSYWWTGADRSSAPAFQQAGPPG